MITDKKHKPIECWVNIYPKGYNNTFHSTIASAENLAAKEIAIKVAVHMVEVVDEGT